MPIGPMRPATAPIQHLVHSLSTLRLPRALGGFASGALLAMAGALLQVLLRNPLAEPYVHYRDNRSFPEVVVPAGSYYVLGDNRGNSEDSRAWGFVPANAFIGRAVFGVWPLSQIGKLH